jgi:sugar phosphate isomerase/epimerase
MFEAVPSPYFGLNYDPSHFVWQMIDYIKPLYEFKDRIFHVHCKDVKLYRDKLADVGALAYPLAFMAPKLPGLGDVDWGGFAGALNDIGYDGPVCVELEDRAFEKDAETIEKGLILSKRYLSQFFACAQ